MSAQGEGGCLLSGVRLGERVSAQGGVVQLPSVDRMTDACKNITFPVTLN